MKTRNYFIIGALVVFTIAYIFLSKSYFEDTSLFNESIVEKRILPSLISSNIIYNPNSEQICSEPYLTKDGWKKKCSLTQHPYKPYIDNSGRTLSDVSTLKYENNVWRFDYNDLWFEIEYAIVKDGQEIREEDFNSEFSSASREKVTREDSKIFNWGIDLNNMPKIDYLIYRVKNSSVPFEITNDFKLDFGEVIVPFKALEDKNWTLSTSRNDEIIATPTNSISLSNSNKYDADPTIELDYTDIAVDYYSRDTNSFNHQVDLMRWNISDVPSGVTIVQNKLCLYETTTGFGTLPDNDLNLSRINNQTWDFSTNTISLYGQLDNTTSTTWFDLSGGAVGTNEYWCANVTNTFQVDYDLGNTFTSVWLEDPDRPYNGAEASKVDSSILKYSWTRGDADFGSSTYTNTSRRPYMNITYEAEANAPNVTLFFPQNNSNITSGRGIESNFTIQVEDDTEIDYVELWSTFRNGTSLLEQTNSTSGFTLVNYTWDYNFSDWFDAKSIFQLAGTPMSSHTSSRAVALNGTHWFYSDYTNDEVYVYNLSNEQVYNFSIPSQFILDIGVDKDTNRLAMVGASNDFLYTYFPNGTQISSCDLDTPFSTIVVSGVDYHPNGTIYVLSSETTERIYITDKDCTDLGQFDIPDGNPAYLTMTNNTAYYIESTENPDRIYGVDFSGSLIESIPFSTIIGDTNGPYAGLTVNKSIIQNYTSIENLYLTHASSTNELTAVRRYYYEEGLTFTGYACDIYGSCDWASNGNYTFNVRNISTTIECYTETENSLHIPYECSYQTSGGLLI